MKPSLDAACPHCEQSLSGGHRCAGCGWSAKADRPLLALGSGRVYGRPNHSIVAAVLYSLLCIPGGGQIYNRQYGKAVTVFLMAALSVQLVGGFAYPFILVFAALDAGVTAGRLAHEGMVRPWDLF